MNDKDMEKNTSASSKHTPDREHELGWGWGTDLHMGHVVATRLLQVRQLQLLCHLAHRLPRQHKVDPGQLTLLLLGHISSQDIIQACGDMRGQNMSSVSGPCCILCLPPQGPEQTLLQTPLLPAHSIQGDKDIASPCSIALCPMTQLSL